MSKTVKVGIKETKEFMIGLNALLIFLIERFCDGVQISDFAAIYNKITKDEEFISKMALAYEGYINIPNELDNLDLYDALDITKLQLDFIPLIVGAFRVEPAPTPDPVPVPEPLPEPPPPVVEEDIEDETIEENF